MIGAELMVQYRQQETIEHAKTLRLAQAVRAHRSAQRRAERARAAQSRAAERVVRAQRLLERGVVNLSGK